MNIAGEISNIKQGKDNIIVSIKQKNSNYFVQGAKLKDFKKGDILSITNLEKKARFLRTTYLFTEKTTISLNPNIYITPNEISFSRYCPYAPFLSSFLGKKINEENNELKFYNGIKEESENQIAKIAKRYPKELKGKFSYKSMHFSKQFGIFFTHILHFGKFPVIFEGNEVKGILLAADSGIEKYISINTENGTMEEKKFKKEELDKILDKRNSVVRFCKGDSFENYLNRDSAKECNENCPLFNYCKNILLNADKKTEFHKFLTTFSKQCIKERKLFLKTTLNGENPIRGSVKGSLKEKNKNNGKTVYNVHITYNEPWIKEGEKVIITENPPLSRKAFASVESVNFSNILIKGEDKILKPEVIAPLDEALPIYRGIYDFLYSDNSSYKYFAKQKPFIMPFQMENYIQNDSEQNMAVNKIINFSGIFLLSGENGTGKKFVLRKASIDFLKKGRKILVVCESRKKEIEEFFKEELGMFIGKEKPMQIYSMYDKNLYLEEPVFDYVIIFLESEVEKNILLSIAGKAKNVIFSTSNFVPFDDKIPKENRAKLLTEHRFGEHILHFLQPILNDKVSPSDDKLLSMKDTSSVSKEFQEIVSPEKFVQFVAVKGKDEGTNNKWNDEEATFITFACKEFLKSGINSHSIGIITPYERQKAYIKKMLDISELSNIHVSLPENSLEKDIIFISFTNTHKLGGNFRDPIRLKTALTRARSKIILVGNKNIGKASKLLSKLL
jgi:hypothetical protein